MPSLDDLKNAAGSAFDKAKEAVGGAADAAVNAVESATGMDINGDGVVPEKVATADGQGDAAAKPEGEVAPTAETAAAAAEISQSERGTIDQKEDLLAPVVAKVGEVASAASNKAEELTGIDIDGNGVVGTQAGAAEGQGILSGAVDKIVGVADAAFDKIESVAGVDIDGDGDIAGVTAQDVAAAAVAEAAAEEAVAEAVAEEVVAEAAVEAAVEEAAGETL
ncbi:MAG: hypothetical protein IJ131_10550 [Eggerthellaceae bacterium]|nr:hypothetical protein [Eggerthellaceae bacterium]